MEERCMVGSIPHGESIECNKGRGICYVVCGMML